MRLKVSRVATTMGVIIAADFGADRESGGHGYADPRHFVQARSFTAEQIAHFGIAFRFTVSEEENISLFARH